MMWGGAFSGRGFGPGSMSRGGTPRSMSYEKTELKGSPWPILRRLGGVVAEYKLQMALAVACILAGSGLHMLMPLAFKHVIDVTIPSGDPNELVLIGLGLAVLQFVRYGLGYGHRYYIAVVSQQMVYRMAKELFEHIERLSLRFFERWGTGEIISRTTNDIGVMQQAISGGTVMAAVSVVNMVAFGVIMALLNWKLALLVYCTVPMLAVASFVTAEMLRVRFLRVREKIADVNNVLQENISGVRVSKAFAREGEQRRRFQSENRGNLEAHMSTASVQAVGTPTIQMISAFGMAVVLGIGTWQVFNHTLTIGTLVAFVSYLIQFYQPVEELIRVNNTLQQALAAAERIFEFMDEQPDVVEKPHAIVLPMAKDEGRTTNDGRVNSSTVDGRRPTAVDVAGEVRLEGVWFSYLPGKPVLQDINLVAAPGRVVALVGPTGSGKTTLVNLIPRFYDPDSGRVLFDGHDLRDLSLTSLRDHIAVVIQETFLFSASTRDNIRYGNLDETDEAVEAAAREAHAHEFIMQLRDGYESQVGEGGVLISRGQRQRIALARAILKDPRILILDEATSDVDTETELLIQRALERVMRGRTTFVIAHRLSTIRHADQILVLDHGRIVERGRHSELLARGGAYAALYAAQFAGQEAAQERVEQLAQALGEPAVADSAGMARQGTLSYRKPAGVRG